MPPVDKASPEAQLRSLLGLFDAKRQKLIRSVRATLRRRLPSANELVYDYRSFFVVAYSATDHPIQAVLSFAARPDGVRLYLMNGPRLPDPKKLLKGAAKQVRFIPLETARRLSHPDVKALMAAALELAKVPLPAKGRGTLIVRTFGGKRRPRQKPAR